jgi:DNA polymerase V
MGYQLKDLANGIDETNIEDKYEPKEKGLSNGQTLRRNYTKNEADLILREMNDDLAVRLRRTGMLARKVSLWISYSEAGTFAKQLTLPIATDDTDALHNGIRELMALAPNLPTIRGLSISYGQLRNSDFEQISLFDEAEKRIERSRLDESLDTIRAVYGPNSVLRCSSLLKESTAHGRHEQIGGHKQ